AGIRVGFSLTLIGTILGEMFAAQGGLGYLLMNAIGLHNVDVIMAVTLLLVVFAAGVSTMLLWADRPLRYLAWTLPGRGAACNGALQTRDRHGPWWFWQINADC